MKLILSPPRVASVFYANKWHQDNPHYIPHIERFQDFNYRTSCKSQNKLTKRFKKLHQDCKNDHLVKILTVKNVAPDIYRYIIKEQIPTTFIYRRDYESWMLSAALIRSTGIVNVFKNLVWVLHSENNKKTISWKPTNILKNPDLYKDLICKEEAIRINYNAMKRCKFLEKRCNVENILYYEDIIKMEYKDTAQMPKRIHNMSKEEIYNCFANKDELKHWIEKYKIE